LKHKWLINSIFANKPTVRLILISKMLLMQTKRDKSRSNQPGVQVFLLKKGMIFGQKRSFLNKIKHSFSKIGK